MALPEGRGFGVGRGFLARYYTAYWKWRFSFTRYKYQAFLYTVSSIRSVTSTRVSFSLIYLRGSWLPNSYLFQAATWTIFRQVARNLTKPCCCINNKKMFEYITTISLILIRPQFPMLWFYYFLTNRLDRISKAFIAASIPENIFWWNGYGIFSLIHIICWQLIGFFLMNNHLTWASRSPEQAN